MHKHPIIGITADYQEEVNCYSKYPWFALRRHYSKCLEIFDCSPVILPISENIKNIDFLDGLLISGGDFDIDPSFYGQEIKSNKVQTIPKRTEFEINLIDLFIKTQKPILGICGGCQLINVYFKGTLIQDIKSNIEHEQPNPRNQTSHSVSIIKNTFLSTIIKKEKIKVNSAHHQAVKRVGSGLNVNAIASDGVIEGIEDKNLNFCIGLQWHPEFLIEESDKQVYKKFLKAANKNV